MSGARGSSGKARPEMGSRMLHGDYAGTTLVRNELCTSTTLVTQWGCTATTLAALLRHWYNKGSMLALHWYYSGTALVLYWRPVFNVYCAETVLALLRYNPHWTGTLPVLHKYGNSTTLEVTALVLHSHVLILRSAYDRTTQVLG